MRIPITDYVAGAAVATDLVNTSPTVRADRGEALTGPEALAGFLAEHGLRPDALAGGLTEEDVHQVWLLRREVRAILETATEEHAVAGAAVLTGRAGLAPVLHRDADGRWQWHVPTAPGASLADELAALVGIALFGVVRVLGHARFRACAAPGCRGVFADTSRGGRRAYCAPELCGNRRNVADHRARRRAGSAAR
ncbi:CGNR zinc finger domain-containing protein [Nonomuraea muscovyensis]|uniref:Putative RNA-binding Zn ribbon-like protein n=1 Tax=Nonomuraea muscovyensis TaxID=1124761 RepID=A0A7X0C3Y2_9ACTN|nr:CGNR zinc finger domain-containing protein [Nonomuraea muscovyensis]MBB6348057.1 putative RNA-binding Zn ribbon-like protein [Nonomuraea muscovyensis]